MHQIRNWTVNTQLKNPCVIFAKKDISQKPAEQRRPQYLKAVAELRKLLNLTTELKKDLTYERNYFTVRMKNVKMQGNIIVEMSLPVTLMPVDQEILKKKKLSPINGKSHDVKKKRRNSSERLWRKPKAKERRRRWTFFSLTEKTSNRSAVWIVQKILRGRYRTL